MHKECNNNLSIIKSFGFSILIHVIVITVLDMYIPSKRTEEDRNAHIPTLSC